MPGEGPPLTLKPDNVAEIGTALLESILFESQSHGVAELRVRHIRIPYPFPLLSCVALGKSILSSVLICIVDRTHYIICEAQCK